ncbi:glutamate--tRNA ligase [Oceanicella actignis]|uniref:Glutamate--tRNA ligase n=1 Tax=Oceanicella actignis TaxID=1189325 RepID=A0A1M7RUQ3_9RHOB|nr:glutamate--tRNA ligase [Oceanicella actignis]SET02623.1 glutamyl-tRNA synthetase [Oceanicella actignis]SHN50047.1 glutamyl-tRNA synthetase [Oceanicella actignis]
MTVVTRFAPSPTGLLHVGNLRTALFNWLFARKAGGRFVLRLDDTDAERSRPEFADAIRRDLEWMGLDWDQELRQSERMDLYRARAEALRGQGRLYPCWETPDELERKRRLRRMQGRPPIYDRAALALDEDERARLGAQRPPHWRFLLEHRREGWDDLFLGPREVDAASMSDPVLIREDGQFLYTLCSVADDADLGVTHVLRGADHVSNTAVQMQIFRALGAEAPVFGHHALLTGPGGAPLSKRLGGLSLADLRAQGVEPMALASILARLGGAAAPEPRLSLRELIAEFDPAAFGAAPAAFDPADARAMTARILRLTPYEAAAPALAARNADLGPRFWETVRENVASWDEAAAWARILREGARPDVAPEDRAFVAEALALLPPRPWDETAWKRWTDAVKAASGRKGRALFMPLRKALTGKGSGPDMSRLMPLMQGPAPRPEDVSAD